jgi:hypothetical protein
MYDSVCQKTIKLQLDGFRLKSFVWTLIVIASQFNSHKSNLGVRMYGVKGHVFVNDRVVV